MSSKGERIEELEEKIQYHRKQYYNGEAEISDAEYDALEDELRKLDPNNSALSSVGASPTGSKKWEKVRHFIPMTSLNKVNDPEELSDWRNNACAEASIHLPLRDDPLFYWSEKLDGISIALYYKDGELHQAVTRGDGKVGEDILANVVLMRNAPESLDKPLTGRIRGEIVLPFHFYEEHLSGYSNPRNAASGIARLEDRKEAQKCRYLSVYAYDCHLKGGPNIDTEFEKFRFLEDTGFSTPNHGGPFEVSKIEELYERYENDLRSDLNYDIDGLVVRFNDQEDYEKAGLRGGNPHGAVALKFASETALTRVKDVTWQIGNTGRITPVAEFEPVNLFGAEIQRASLYNCSEIERLNLNTQDEILVERANDVIPKVLEVTEKHNSGTVDIPEECPSCGNTNLDWEGEYLVCNSKECPAQLTGKLQAWIDALGILDWGSFILEKIVEEGLVESISDLYELEKEQLAQLRDKGDKRVGMKTSTKLIDKLHNNTEMLLEDFLGGLRIPLCRQKTFQMLIEEGYDSLEEIRTLTKENLESIDGIGPEKADKLYHGLQKREQEIDNLLEWIDIESASGGLEDLNICITGSLSKTRSEVKQDIKEAGGIYKGMSKKVDYLVAADLNSGSSKLKKAEKYDIPIISEEELYEMM